MIHACRRIILVYMHILLNVFKKKKKRQKLNQLKKKNSKDQSKLKKKSKQWYYFDLLFGPVSVAIFLCHHTN